MKKKIFGIVIVTALTLLSSWNFNQGKSKVILSDLALANIEALAQGEGIDGVVLKECYDLFVDSYDGYYYATCSFTSSTDIIYECGAITAKHPLWGAQKYQCYQRV